MVAIIALIGENSAILPGKVSITKITACTKRKSPFPTEGSWSENTINENNMARINVTTKKIFI